MLSTDTEERETVLIVEGPPDFSYSYGAKGIAEITAIPTPAGVAGVYHKYDGTWRYSLPLTDTPYKNNYIEGLRK